MYAYFIRSYFFVLVNTLWYLSLSLLLFIFSVEFLHSVTNKLVSTHIPYSILILSLGLSKYSLTSRISFLNLLHISTIKSNGLNLKHWISLELRTKM
ncbi:hypothetical protein Lalb_Chr04g0258141 [Lupinus albus]|uniref:Uncharacterized protein n=1 Tax=Lupinus albus TaxID=3870 RepID=A0A6A4QQ71_LUPAL|nr:hypothetical protein Lalb_Chr04g0258141 [Lupinus albus]